MKIKDMTKEDLELLSLCDITAIILRENKKSMNTAAVFKKICELLQYSDEEYTDKIGEFYTSLTTDKRFVMLETSEWDLRDNHSLKFELEDEEEIDDSEDEEEEMELEEEVDDNVNDDDSLNLDDHDNEIDNLSIVVEDEEEMD